MIKVKWDVEGLVALIDIYERFEKGKVVDLESELLLLSEALNRRTEVLDIPHDEKYRNLNGMKMMYQNVVYITTNGAQGMSSASLSMYTVYNLLHTNPEAFCLILCEFRNRYINPSK